MAVLQMRDTVFARGGIALVGPLNCELAEGERRALTFATAEEADVAAMLAAACARATSGHVFIGGFDPRIQPVQCKRIVGYVPHEVVPPAFASLDDYVGYRAALWSLDANDARALAAALLERLPDVHESFAYPLVGALIGKPRLLVLERPQAAYARMIRDVTSGCAVLSTHASAHEAEAFA